MLDLKYVDTQLIVVQKKKVFTGKNISLSQRKIVPYHKPKKGNSSDCEDWEA